MSGATDNQLFHGLVTTANALFLSDADFVTINGITKPTLKKIYAEFLASIGTYTTVAEGLTKTNGTGTNNRFFTVPGTGDVFETRYRNDAGVAVEISSLLSWLADALTINRGKAYPLRQMNRGGVTSPANAVMNRFLLNCEVLGADATKYYMIAFQKNGAALAGSYEFGWILYEADIATYATTGAVTQIHHYSNVAPNIDRAGGVQTLLVTPELRPDLRFKIVVDASALPASGTAIDSSSGGTNGRSWIVDPSRYSAPPVIRDDSLSINRGKALPLKQMNRGGITSPANAVMNRFLLGAKVEGAEPGKYYLITLQKNGAPLTGDYEFGWILYEADAATYETTGAIVQIHSQADPAPAINRSGGLQTVFVRPRLRPAIRFEITLDAAALPAAGTPIDSNSTGSPGRGWIVDPSCYVETAFVKENSLTINKGKSLPLRQMNRGGIISIANTVMDSLLLDCEIIGADPSKYYQIAFQKNGAPLSGSYEFGWIFYEADPVTFASTGAVVAIHTHVDPAPVIDRAGGVQTVLVTPRARPNMRFKITLDAAALPPAGTAVDSNSATATPGRSWIVDPSRYTAPPFVPRQLQAGSMWVDGGTTANDFDFVWSHGADQMFMLKMGPNQINQLFNFKGWYISPLAPLDSAVWQILSGSDTDWFPPMVVEAVNNGDGGAPQFTGGGHWNEVVLELPTARMVNFKASINGQEMAPGQVYSGPADVATFSWQCELQAFNTMTLNRYVMRQHFVAHVTAGSIEVIYETEALEAVTVRTEHGPQMGVYNAFPDWVHYVGDNRGMMLADDPRTVAAQSKTAAPEVFAVVCGHATRGFCASWLDRNYEAGDGRYVLPNSPFARRNAGGWKFYQAVISGVPTTFQAGEGYKWRGGYAFAPRDIVQGDVNCAFRYMKGAKPHLVWAFNAAGNGRVNPVPSIATKKVGAAVVGARGLDVSATGYAFGNAEIQ